MKSVWKFPFNVASDGQIALPKGAEILHVEEQAGVPCFWALVDPAAERELLSFRIFGTGFDIPSNYTSREHIGTFLSDGGRFVWHVFKAL